MATDDDNYDDQLGKPNKKLYAKDCPKHTCTLYDGKNTPLEPRTTPRRPHEMQRLMT